MASQSKPLASPWCYLEVDERREAAPQEQEAAVLPCTRETMCLGDRNLQEMLRRPRSRRVESFHRTVPQKLRARSCLRPSQTPVRKDMQKR